MRGENLFVSRKLTNSEIVNAISHLYDAVPTEILLSRESGDWLDKAKGMRVVCVVFVWEESDFPTVLHITPFVGTEESFDWLQAAEWLSKTWNANILVSSWDKEIESPNAYTLIRGINDIQNVIVDPKLLSDKENPRVSILVYLD